jgi:hypothetical protein
MNYLSADETHSARTKLFERPGIGTGGFPALKRVYGAPKTAITPASRRSRPRIRAGLTLLKHFNT